MSASAEPGGRVSLVRYPDSSQLVTATADRLLITLRQVQTTGKLPQVCLTGGRIAAKIYQRLAEIGTTGGVDWSLVEFWWGDERWVPADDPARNDRATIHALAPLGINPELVHPMPAPPAPGGRQAATAYAAELGQVEFDICLLSIGPDGHIASLFPQQDPQDAPVFFVADSPKPPAQRLTVNYSVLNNSDQVWILASGAEKAEAVAAGLLPASPDLPAVPAGAVHGKALTLWLVDEAAASELPATL